jgi:ankyrin repeat protein
MSKALPAHPSLDWLRKTAKQHLRELRSQRPAAHLAEAQLAIAREYGFASWRALKAHVERAPAPEAEGTSAAERKIADFLRSVGAGQIDSIRTSLSIAPELVNAIGPHPYWGGRPQPLHVSIETRRRDVFDLLLAAGADVNGSNREYADWSPLMLTYHWDQPDVRRVLLEHGARVGLIEAMLAGDDQAVEAMLRPGRRALPDIRPNEGSILAFARTTFAIDRLLELGVERDTKDRWETSPIEAMSRLGPSGLPLVRHMISRGIQASPEEYARIGDRTTLAALIARDPRIARSEEVFNAAVDFSHYELVSWLLEQGANVNSRSAIGAQGTGLHSAAWEGNLRMAKLLVDAGADLTARDREHNGTPHDWALTAIEVTNNRQCREVADYLESMMRDANYREP